MISLQQLLLQYRHTYNAVVPLAQTDTVSPLNLTKQNTDLTEFIFNDTEAFSTYIQQQLIKTNSRYLIGGYNELREMYKRSALFNFEKTLCYFNLVRID